jgi:hypothetical protein
VATNTDRTAAELALVRLEKELVDATAFANSLEESSRSFNPQDLMSEGEAVAARQRAEWLHAELKAHENDFLRWNNIMHGLAVLVIIGCGVYSFSQHGFFAILGRLVVSIPLGILFVFLLSIGQEFITEAPRKHWPSEVANLRSLLDRHETGLAHQRRSSYLPDARASLERINQEIARNQRVLLS